MGYAQCALSVMPSSAKVLDLEAEVYAAFDTAFSKQTEIAMVESEALAGCFYAEVEELISDGGDGLETEQLLDSWQRLLVDVLSSSECGDPEGVAEAIMLQLQFKGALNIPQDDGSRLEAVITEGTCCVARLIEDEEWHEARVLEVLGDGHFVVQFDLGSKRQEVGRDDLVPMEELTAGDDVGEDECPICHRVMQLTRHHLVPRS